MNICRKIVNGILTYQHHSLIACAQVFTAVLGEHFKIGQLTSCFAGYQNKALRLIFIGKTHRLHDYLTRKLRTAVYTLGYIQRNAGADIVKNVGILHVCHVVFFAIPLRPSLLNAVADMKLSHSLQIVR